MKETQEPVRKDGHILFINLAYKKIREEVLRLSVCVGIC